jgi:hypothetical protein
MLLFFKPEDPLHDKVLTQNTQYGKSHPSRLSRAPMNGLGEVNNNEGKGTVRMNHIKKGLCTALLLAAIACAVAAKDKTGAIKIERLYEDFENADYSTLDMEQYQQTVTVQGVVLDIDTSLFSSSEEILVSLGAEAGGNELARLVFAPDAKLKKVKIGQTIVASGDVAFSSGTDYIPLESCELK